MIREIVEDCGYENCHAFVFLLFICLGCTLKRWRVSSLKIMDIKILMLFVFLLCMSSVCSLCYFSNTEISAVYCFIFKY